MKRASTRQFSFYRNYRGALGMVLICWIHASAPRAVKCCLHCFCIASMWAAKPGRKQSQLAGPRSRFTGFVSSMWKPHSNQAQIFGGISIKWMETNICLSLLNNTLFRMLIPQPQTGPGCHLEIPSIQELLFWEERRLKNRKGHFEYWGGLFLKLHTRCSLEGVWWYAL